MIKDHPMPSITLRTNLFPVDPEGDLYLCNGSPGSPLAHWLKYQLSELGYACDTPTQEDYGWGFWVTTAPEQTKIWMYVGLSEEDEGPKWVIGADHEFFPLNFRQLLLRRKGKERSEAILQSIREIAREEPGMTAETEN